MIDGKSILAIIPARGGSKGVPGKNLKVINGKPLIDYTIIFAKDSKIFDKIVVSSDDDEICSHSLIMEVDVIKRPFELAQDGSLVVDAIRYTLNKLEELGYIPDFIFLLEPTSPLRDKEHLSLALKALNEGYDSATTFCEIDPPPGRIWTIEGLRVEPLLSGSNPFLPRQEQPIGYKLTGQLYGFKRKNIYVNQLPSIIQGRVFPIITDPKNVVDIDTEIDFLITEQIMKYNEKN